MMFPKPTGRRRDPDYMARVRELPCILMRCGGCWGRMEANHAGERPVGRKCDDDETVPMCSAHHRWWTDAQGGFYGWSRELRRAWSEWAIEQTRARLALDAAGFRVEEVTCG
jgi:hypothetical protein